MRAPGLKNVTVDIHVR